MRKVLAAVLLHAGDQYDGLAETANEELYHKQ